MDVYILMIVTQVGLQGPGLGISSFQTEEDCKAAIEAIEAPAVSINPDLYFDCVKGFLPDPPESLNPREDRKKDGKMPEPESEGI